VSKEKCLACLRYLEYYTAHIKDTLVDSATEKWDRAMDAVERIKRTIDVMEKERCITRTEADTLRSEQAGLALAVEGKDYYTVEHYAYTTRLVLFESIRRAICSPTHKS